MNMVVSSTRRNEMIIAFYDNYVVIRATAVSADGIYIDSRGSVQVYGDQGEILRTITLELLTKQYKLKIPAIFCEFSLNTCRDLLEVAEAIKIEENEREHQLRRN
jgi:hypothetical protein